MKNFLSRYTYLKTLRFQMMAALLSATLLIVAANGGYFSLHKLPDQPTTPDTKVKTNKDACARLKSLTTTCGSLQSANIGSVTGSATYDACDSDTISISANDVPSSTADKQYSVQREVCGNGEVIVKVLSVSGGLAGLELRASNAPGAIKVGLRTALSSTVQRFVRTSTDGTQSSNTLTASGHQWLKLVRSGSSVTTYTSTNGSTWNFAASYTVSLPTCVQAGLLMQSVNIGTTHTGVFKDLQFSTFTEPTRDTTTLSFAQDTISATEGDTVTICVNIDHPCVCSPTEVTVALVTDSLPHLVDFDPQTLTFAASDTMKCFSIVLEEADSNETYSFELTNLDGGYQTEVGAISTLPLEVKEHVPGYVEVLLEVHRV